MMALSQWTHPCHCPYSVRGVQLLLDQVGLPMRLLEEC